MLCDTKGTSVVEEDGDQSPQCLPVWTLSGVCRRLRREWGPYSDSWTEYEPGDWLFMTRILLESTAEDLCAASMTSQKLTERAHRSTKTRKEPFILPDCIRGFKSIFSKEDFDILPEHRQWDHAIELVLGLKPKLLKVYCKGTLLFPPLNGTTTLWSYLSLFY